MWQGIAFLALLPVSAPASSEEPGCVSHSQTPTGGNLLGPSTAGDHLFDREAVSLAGFLSVYNQSEFADRPYALALSSARHAYLGSREEDLSKLVKSLREALVSDGADEAIARLLTAQMAGYFAQPALRPAARDKLDALAGLPALAEEEGAPVKASEFNDIRWNALVELTEASGELDHAAKAYNEINERLHSFTADDWEEKQAAARTRLILARALMAMIKANDYNDSLDLFDRLGTVLQTISDKSSLDCGPIFYGRVKMLEAERFLGLAQTVKHVDENRYGSFLQQAEQKQREAAKALLYEHAPTLWAMNQVLGARINAAQYHRLMSGTGNDPSLRRNTYLNQAVGYACEARSAINRIEAAMSGGAPENIREEFEAYCQPDNPPDFLAAPETQSGEQD